MAYDCARLLRTSGSVVRNFVTSWTLRNFSQSEHSPGSMISSLDIVCDNNVRWRIIVFPGGQKNSDSSGEYVSCYLRFFPPGNYMKVRSVISFRTFSGELLIRSDRSNWCFPGHTGTLGATKFVRRKALLQLLTNDILVVCVELSCSKSVAMTDSERCEFGEVHPLTHFADDMASLLSTGKHGDVTFCIGRKRIPAHKAVLAARSRMFAAMFEHDFEENYSCKVEVSDFDEKSFKSLLQFMYSGSVDTIDSSLAVEVLRAADKYDLQDLKAYCGYYLTAELNSDNVLEVLVAADLYSASALREKALEYFCRNRLSIDIKNHRDILQQYPNILVDIVTSM